MEVEELKRLVDMAYKINFYENYPVRRIFKGISKAEYKRCKKAVMEYKAKYGDLIADGKWNYFYLSAMSSFIERGKASSVEEAIRLFDEELSDFIRKIEEAPLD